MDMTDDRFKIADGATAAADIGPEWVSFRLWEGASPSSRDLTAAPACLCIAPSPSITEYAARIPTGGC